MQSFHNFSQLNCIMMIYMYIEKLSYYCDLA